MLSLLAAMPLASSTACQSQDASPAGQPTVQLVPSLTDAPAVTLAPGQGMTSTVSPHLAATPFLFKLDAQPIEVVSPLISRQVLHGSQSTFAKWTMKKGAIVPLHHHANEQITWIVEGSAFVYSQGKKYTLGAGDIMIIPANVPHEFHFTEDTIDIDIFAPQRQDWIDGTANYIKK